MTSHSDKTAEGVHFVVRHNGQLHITDDSYVYDPGAHDLTADDTAAIQFLEALLGTSEVVKLDNSVLEERRHKGWKINPPPPYE